MLTKTSVPPLILHGNRGLKIMVLNHLAALRLDEPLHHLRRPGAFYVEVILSQ